MRKLRTPVRWHRNCFPACLINFNLIVFVTISIIYQYEYDLLLQDVPMYLLVNKLKLHENMLMKLRFNYIKSCVAINEQIENILVVVEYLFNQTLLEVGFIRNKLKIR